jgi:hypothetical protein
MIMDEIHTPSCWCVARRATLILFAAAVLAMLFGVVELPLGNH